MSIASVAGLAATGLAAALVTVSVTFVLARRRGRYDTIDTAWGAGFAVIALVSFAVAGAWDPRGTGLAAPVVTALTVGVRLSVHLPRRNRGKPEDPRYQEMVRRAGDNPAPHMSCGFT
ncbi:steroid 5-alpha reductase family enzyme [Saccharopolyspora lacisalsi]|uniref:Steroid 5-alpha reductase family enzyme n=1 Tax=Halosaccharopolyspora lacisalsi TaxID=1000566 RepID=A0A839DV38_9PSEU|nr:steroid 5-alpha reductase family enzyme [Halosaccharopolyspora lacisalsi]